jgi:sugar phosphate isomerase/epimerase
VDVVESIRVAGSRLFDVHIKDVSDLSNADSQVPVGEGRMPIPAIFRELKKVKYRGGVMLEYEIDENDPFPGMAKSFAYMRGVLAGMQA